MKTLLKVIGTVAVVGIVGALIVGAVAFAQGPQTDGFSPRNFAGQQSMHRGAMGAQMDGLMRDDMEETMHTAIADALGISEETLETEMAAGKTMFDIAAEQGIDVNTVWAAMQTARADALQQAVADGTLTQTQADWMSQRGGMKGGNAQAHGQMGGHGQMGSHGSNAGQYNGDCPYDTAQ